MFPITLVKLAGAIEVDVFELFRPLIGHDNLSYSPETEKMRRFAKDLTIALDVSTAEAAKILQNTMAKVCIPLLNAGEYLG